MHLLPLVAVLAFAAPSVNTPGVRETKEQRAARLMTETELAQLGAIDGKIAALAQGPGNQVLFASSIALMAAAVVAPIGLAVVGLVGTIGLGFVGGLFALAGNTSILALIPQMWVTIFSWVPVWGWILMGAAAVVGGGLLVAALVSDGPRRRQVHELRVQRNMLIRDVLAREPQAMQPVPMTTLVTF